MKRFLKSFLLVRTQKHVILPTMPKNIKATLSWLTIWSVCLETRRFSTLKLLFRSRWVIFFSIMIGKKCWKNVKFTNMMTMSRIIKFSFSKNKKSNMIWANGGGGEELLNWVRTGRSLRFWFISLSETSNLKFVIYFK